MGCNSSEPSLSYDKSTNNQVINNNHAEDIPLMELRNTECHVKKIHSNQTAGMRAIVISDTHLGKFSPAEPHIPKLFEYLNKIVEDNSATIIFWLGDIFDIKAENRQQNGQLFIDLFSQFQVPIQFISGNHDRSLYHKLNVHGSMIYNREKILKIRSQSPNEISLFLSHDFGNSFRVKNEDVPSFLISNKIAQKNFIKSDDWVLTGHVHFTYINEKNKIASISPFSFDLDCFSYCLITDNSNGFNFSFHKFVSNE